MQRPRLRSSVPAAPPRVAALAARGDGERRQLTAIRATVAFGCDCAALQSPSFPFPFPSAAPLPRRHSRSRCALRSEAADGQGGPHRGEAVQKERAVATKQPIWSCQPPRPVRTGRWGDDSAQGRHGAALSTALAAVAGRIPRSSVRFALPSFPLAPYLRLALLGANQSMRALKRRLPRVQIRRDRL